MRVVVDVDATLRARERYPLFGEIIVGTFEQSASLYRLFDGEELGRVLASGKLTGGNYSVKPEREHGASWGHDVSAIIRWGNSQRGGRLGKKLFLAKIDTLDRRFAHLGPGFDIDPSGPLEQSFSMPMTTCNLALGCSVMNVDVDDVDVFYRVREDGQIERLSYTELKAAVQPEADTTPDVEAPSPKQETPEKIRGDWALKPKDKVQVTKGSTRLGIAIRNTGSVRDVWQMPGDSRTYVTLSFVWPLKPSTGSWHGKPITLFAMHPNRLSDSEIPLLNSRGDRILIRKR